MNSNTPIFPELGAIETFLGQDGNTYAKILNKGNPYALRVGSRNWDLYVQQSAKDANIVIKNSDIRDINNALQTKAELAGITHHVWLRVASVDEGIEIDTGHSNHSRIRITPGKVDTIHDGSDAIFCRTPSMRPLPVPDEQGDLHQLRKYLNLDAASATLLIAWITYTLSHPKISTTNYVILVLQGDQGSGKTTLCENIIQNLVDPSIVGMQAFPNNQSDLVIAAQHAHVLFFDNMRSIRQFMSDTLCIAATGGALTTRQLYTDADQHVHRLHAALVLNGIHSFIDQPDLADRCLQLRLKPIEGSNRKPEHQLLNEFQSDLPVIFRGLLDLISNILTHLPSTTPDKPERMIEFSRWLAAMEKVDSVPPTVYQREYTTALNDAMLDSLLENPLAEAVINFSTKHPDGWSSTPGALLAALNTTVGARASYSKDWPKNEISLSKRLQGLQAGLRRQGVYITRSRGKHRNITITTMGDSHNESEY